MLSKIDSPIRTKKERISESVRILNRVPKGGASNITGEDNETQVY